MIICYIIIMRHIIIIIIIIIITLHTVVLLTSMPFSLPDPPPPWELCTVFMVDYRLSFRTITTTTIFSNVPESRLRYWYNFRCYNHHHCCCCLFSYCCYCCYYRRRRNQCLRITLSPVILCETHFSRGYILWWYNDMIASTIVQNYNS